MSQEAVEHCSTVKTLIGKSTLKPEQEVYPLVVKQIKQARDFYINWIEIYQEYERGLNRFKPKLEQDSINSRTESASISVDNCETEFKEIILARIPTENYLFVSWFFDIFRKKPSFVLHENRTRFQTINLITLANADFTRFPASKEANTRINALKSQLKENKIRRISYNSTVYNSPQPWLMLMHEAMHEIYDTENIYLLNSNQTSLATMELLLDLMVCFIFGPAYPVALANYHRRYPGGSGESHPKEVVRLYAMLKYIESLPNPIVGKDSQNYADKIAKSNSILSNLWSLQKNNASQSDLALVDDAFDSLAKNIKDYLKKSFIPRFDEFISDYDLRTKDLVVDPPLDRILSWIQKEIPVATDPRIFFNAILDMEQVNPMLVTESVKRWTMLSKWREQTKLRSLNGS